MAVAQSSFTNKGLLKIFWFISNTSTTVPLLELQKVTDFTKFERLYVSLRSENDCFHHTLDQACWYLNLLKRSNYCKKIKKQNKVFKKQSVILFWGVYV